MLCLLYFHMFNFLWICLVTEQNSLGVCLAASSAQIEQAHTAVERAVISRVYTHALYPNGDGDVSRDQ
jgi:hypothetical protein